ncbi:MAG: DUF6443 domain-containing protein, partial [Bacteroidota bacterium]
MIRYLITGCSFLFALTASSQKIVISEVMYDSPLNEELDKGIHHRGEFIELYNPTNTAVNLTGWRLKDGNSRTQIRIPSGTVIGARDFIVLTYGKTSDPFNYKLKKLYSNVSQNEDKIVYYYGYGSSLLNNTGDFLILFNAQNQEITQVAWEGGNKNNGSLRWRNHAGEGGSLQLISSEVLDAPSSSSSEDYWTKKPNPFELSFDHDHISSIQLDRNRIVTNQIRIGGVTNKEDISTLDMSSRSQLVQYYDGLGRPIQTVATMASPAQQDLVTPIEYDNYGRQSKHYLPFASTHESPGSYHEGWQNHQREFYQDQLSFEQEETFWSEIAHEKSPLNRITRTAAPGAAWNMDSENTMEYEYGSNSGLSIYKFLYNDLTNSIYLAPDLYYDDGQCRLLMAGMTDEDESQEIQIKNLSDQVILSRKQISAGLWAETYSVYDVHGNLQAVLPPMAIQSIEQNSREITQGILDTWAFQYDYDERNRLVSKKLPGIQPVLYVYDKWDRLVLSQDGEQRKENEWLCNKYDRLNRLVLTGIVSDLSIAEIDAIKSESRTDRYDVYNGTNTSLYGYAQTSLPDVYDTEILTVTYYDDYFFKEDNPQLWRGQYTIDTYFSSRAQGQITGTLTRLLDSEVMLKSIYFYDDQSRPIATINENNLGGIDQVNTTYFNRLRSVPKKLESTHKTSTNTKMVTDTYTYDHLDRVLSTTTEIDGNTSTVTNKFNEIGQLINKNLNDVQDLEYDYNIRGWLTKINGGTSFNDSNDIFGMELKY